jgi:flap endonuclease-1
VQINSQEHDIKTLFGRKVAIDASMSIYQFLIAVRQRDGEVLQNEAGETTSHLMGFFYRTIRMVENGIKPCYVFDGKPPELKSGVVSVTGNVYVLSRLLIGFWVFLVGSTLCAS